MSIIIKNKEKTPLPVLWRSALKVIYAPRELKLTERREMEEAIVSWTHFLEDKKEQKGFTAIDEEHQLALELIATELKKDMDGKLDARKELFRARGIDYKKFYRFPDAYTAKDFYEAQEALRQHKISNPEDYE